MKTNDLFKTQLSNMSKGSQIGGSLGSLAGMVTGLGPLAGIAGSVAGAGLGNFVGLMKNISGSLGPDRTSYSPQPAAFAKYGIEVEGGETAMRPNGSFRMFNGPSHMFGGIQYNPMMKGEFVFSDTAGYNNGKLTMGQTNKTFASLSKKFLGKEDMISSSTLDQMRSDNKQILKYGGMTSNYALGGDPTDPPKWESMQDLEASIELSKQQVDQLDAMRRNSSLSADQRQQYEQQWLAASKELQALNRTRTDWIHNDNKGSGNLSPVTLQYGQKPYGSGLNPYEYGTMEYRMYQQAGVPPVNWVDADGNPIDPNTYKPPVASEPPVNYAQITGPTAQSPSTAVDTPTTNPFTNRMATNPSSSSGINSAYPIARDNPYKPGSELYRAFNRVQMGVGDDPNSWLESYQYLEDNDPNYGLDYGDGYKKNPDAVSPFFPFPKTGTADLRGMGRPSLNAAVIPTNPNNRQPAFSSSADPLGFADTYIGGRSYPMSYNEAPDNNQFVRTGSSYPLSYNEMPDNNQNTTPTFTLPQQSTQLTRQDAQTPLVAQVPGNPQNNIPGTSANKYYNDPRYKNALRMLTAQGGLDPNLLNTPAGVKKIQGFLADGKSYFGKIDGVAGNGTAAGLGQWAMVSNPPTDPNAVSLQASALTAPQVNPYTPQQLQQLQTMANTTRPAGQTSSTGFFGSGDINSQIGKVALATKLPSVLFNFAQGMRSEEEPLRLNREGQRAINLMSDLKYDPRQVYNQINQGASIGRAGIRNQNVSPFLQNALSQGITNNAMNSLASANLQGQQMNNSLRAQEAQTRYMVGAGDAAERIRRQTVNSQNRAASIGFTQAGFNDIARGGDSVIGAMLNNQTIQEYAAMLPYFARNFGVDIEGLMKTTKNGEIIKYKK